MRSDILWAQPLIRPVAQKFIFTVAAPLVTAVSAAETASPPVTIKYFASARLGYHRLAHCSAHPLNVLTGHAAGVISTLPLCSVQTMGKGSAYSFCSFSSTKLR